MREKLIELCGDLQELPCCYTYEGQADYLIANGVTIQRWIPVTERLPDSGKRVLAYKNHKDGKIVFWAKHWNNKWFDMEWNCYRYGVTHWMPLPPVPEDVK